MIRSEMIARRVVAEAIWVYQRILSPYLGSQCRFNPSCSEYTRQAVLKYGVKRGLIMGMRRLLRCRPWGGAGYDPVP